MSTGNIGFIGLGQMGLPMASRLAAEHKVAAFDRDQAALDRAVEAGAVPAVSVLEVAAMSDVIFLSLPTPTVVDDVVLGSAGVLSSGGPPCRTVVDLSTTGAPTSERLGEALGSAGWSFVDCPVSGGVRGAERGTLALMAACERAVYDDLEGLLSVLGRPFFVGEKPGLGQTMKLLNNYLSATALAATAEAFVVGAKAGLDPDMMVQVVNAGSGRNSATEEKFPRAILTGTFDAGFASELMLKDLRLFAEQAQSLGVPMWLGASTTHLWQFVTTQLGPDADFTNVIRPLEDWAGVQVRSRRDE